MATINLPKYGNVSTTRLEKMLGTKKEATSLRKTGWYGFWKMFGISTTGTKAREENLKKMYNDFHSDSIQNPPNPKQKIPNNNIERFITFSKMRNVINQACQEENIEPLKFTVKETPSNTGMTYNLEFTIGTSLVTSKPATSLEKIVVQNFVNKDRTLKDNITEEAVSQEHQQQAAAQIQAGVRRLQYRIAQKKPNTYENKEFIYTKGKTSQAFIFSKNNVGHTLPEENIVNSKNKGMFKTVIGNDGKNILFKSNKLPSGGNPPVPKYKAHEIEEILLKNDIKSYKVTTPISKDRSIAHNAGDQDLKSVIFENKQTVPIKEFEEILSDTDKLHRKGFFHLDIKPGNIQCKKLQNGKMKLSMIDLDSFSSINHLISYSGTPTYSQEELYIQNFGYKQQIKSSPTNKSLRVADEFALALTLMEASGIKIPQNNKGLYYTRKGSLTITPAMEQFIQLNVKPNFQDTFRLLVQNPHFYANSENSTGAYLFDMLNIGD